MRTGALEGWDWWRDEIWRIELDFERRREKIRKGRRRKSWQRRAGTGDTLLYNKCANLIDILEFTVTPLSTWTSRALVWTPPYCSYRAPATLTPSQGPDMKIVSPKVYLWKLFLKMVKIKKLHQVKADKLPYTNWQFVTQHPTKEPIQNLTCSAEVWSTFNSKNVVGVTSWLGSFDHYHLLSSKKRTTRSSTKLKRNRGVIAVRQRDCTREFL
jgi:hypothetical protein